MEQLLFIGTEDGTIRTEIKNVGAVKNTTGSVLYISDKVMEQCAKQDNSVTVIKHPNSENVIHYIFNKTVEKSTENLCFTRVQPNRYILCDRNPIGNLTLADIFTEFNFSFKNTKDKNADKKIVCVTFKEVYCKSIKIDENGNRVRKPGGGYEREKTLKQSRQVSLITALKIASRSKIDCKNVMTNQPIDIYDVDGHHKGFGWDYRLRNTQKLNSDKHNDLHSTTVGAGESHDLLVIIRTDRELYAFIEAIRNDEIRYSSKASRKNNKKNSNSK